MKNLFSKTLFISLLLSAAIPSGAQAGGLEKIATVAAFTVLAALKGGAVTQKAIAIATTMGGLTAAVMLVPRIAKAVEVGVLGAAGAAGAEAVATIIAGI